MNRLESARVAFCLAILYLGNLAQAQPGLPNSLKICEGEEEWPPFVYFKRIDGKKNGKEVAGYSIDYIKNLLAKNGIASIIDMIPWKRCQKEVVDGNYDMLLNATKSEERDRLYWVSDAYYKLTGIAFYSTTRPVPKLRKLEDLRNYRICGIRGYTYENYGLSTNQVDSGSANISMAMNKILNNRCDLFLNNLEIIIGSHILGLEDYLHDQRFGYIRITGKQDSSFHMLISRKPSYAEKLKILINQGIIDMEKSGETEKLRKRYLQ
ncbi:hypothetical protein QR66_13150 [Chromobacterium piscinae]|nr:hypothetical protein QR66_13150 [Chromobacterium piscinae]